MRNWEESHKQEDQRTKVPLLNEELPAPNPKKGKKNTRQWCKGKEGREHQIVVKVPDNESWWYRVGKLKKPCRWTQHWRRYSDPNALGHVYWICRHQYVCEVCGKHLGPIPRDACPDLDESTKPEPTPHPRWR